jgi:hypothetical protein
MGWSKRVRGITKHEIVIQISFVRPTDYTTVNAKAMVTKITSYDVLVGWGGFCIPWESPWIFGRRLFIIDQDGK